MKVADLQRFLGEVVPLVRSAGASEKVATELARAVQCLEPFKEKSLSEFNDFLGRADEFDRTGKLSAPPASAAKPRSAKASALTIEEAAQIFTDLHQRATDPALSYADIDARMKPLEKMTIPQLLEVAAKVHVTVPSKPKKEILAELIRRIKELKASDERTKFRLGETA